MRKLIAILLLAVVPVCGFTQSRMYVVDSMKANVANAKTEEEKVEQLGYLSRTLMNIDLAEAERYGLQMIEVAESSRDRKLMVEALLTNGERYSYLSGRTENIQKAITYYKKGLELARQNRLEAEMIKAYLLLSEVSRYIPDAGKALDYCNQAYSYAATLKQDSIFARVHLEFGTVYLVKNEKLLSLRNYMTALRLSEELRNNSLLRITYIRLSSFYAGISDYDKAIDYQAMALKLADQIKSGQSPYNKVQDLVRIGDLYGFKKNYEMATHYYERSLAVADSLKFEPIKALSYRSIINNYLSADQPQKALAYFDSKPQLKNYLTSLNFGHFVDQSYGYIYSRLGKYDSARYYYNKVAPFFEKDVNSGNKLGYNYQLGMLYKMTGEYDKAIGYFNKAKQLADEIGRLEQMSEVSIQLDSLYRIQGDYRQALYYSSLNYQYKDSLDKLGKERDLMQVEVADEQQRQERIAREKLEQKRKRDNIQYLLITIGIAGLFILMVMMGMFKVSKTTIRMIGFFAFLMFFEFIFLIFKKNIYSVTQGEPWKDLLFMILLAAVLLPAHHWLEHKVIHYLTSHNRLTATGKGLLDRVIRRKKPTA